MHPTILAKRKAEAVAKLVFASEALAETMELDSALIAGLHPIGTHDNQLREMMLLEGAANLITAVAIQSGAIKEGVSVETPEPPVHWIAPAEAELPAEEVPAEVEEAAEAVQPEEKPARKTSAAAKKSSRKGAKK